MDERMKELIAIGASVSAHCQPCLTYHLEKAREMGVDEETILAAIETGHMVSKGAMSAMRKFAASLVEAAKGGPGCDGADHGASPKACCG